MFHIKRAKLFAKDQKTVILTKYNVDTSSGIFWWFDDLHACYICRKLMRPNDLGDSWVWRLVVLPVQYKETAVFGLSPFLPWAPRRKHSDKSTLLPRPRSSLALRCWFSNKTTNPNPRVPERLWLSKIRTKLQKKFTWVLPTKKIHTHPRTNSSNPVLMVRKPSHKQNSNIKRTFEIMSFCSNHWGPYSNFNRTFMNFCSYPSVPKMKRWRATMKGRLNIILSRSSGLV